MELKDKDIEILKEYYLKLEKPQISLLLYFLKMDFPSFPDISGEWERKVLIKEGIYSPGARRKIFMKRFEAELPGILVQADSSRGKWIKGNDNFYMKNLLLYSCILNCYLKLQRQICFYCPFFSIDKPNV